MVILNGAQLQARIFEKMKSAPAMDFAVAFWGTGSIEALGLSKLRTGRIICNLTMGGTNPKVIRELIDIGFEVRHLDTLHSKIYLFDDVAFVGSSNASANGLSLQGKALSGWHETNVEISDTSQIAVLKNEFEIIWKISSKISEDDLIHADDLFNRRRSILRLSLNAGPNDLYETFISSTENPWNSTAIYVCGYTEKMSKAALQIIADFQEGEPGGVEIDGFEEWEDLIGGKTVVCFDINQRKTVTYDGVWQVRDRPEAKLPKVHIAHEVTSGAIPYFDEAKLSLWKPAVLRALEASKAKNQTRFLMEIGEFFDKFVKPTT